MVLSGQRLGQEVMPTSRWEQNDSIAQVDDHHPATVIESPSMADGCGYRHLSTRRDLKLSGDSHGKTLHTW